VTFDGKSAGISGRAFRDHSRGLRDLTAHQGALFLHGEFSGGRSVCALSVHDAGEADLAMAVTVDDGHLGAGTIDGFHATSQLPHPGDVYRFQVSTGATIELLTVTVLDVLVGSYFTPYEFVFGYGGPITFYTCPAEVRHGAELGHGYLEGTLLRNPVAMTNSSRV
jgi:hypothetical protein